MSHRNDVYGNRTSVGGTIPELSFEPERPTWGWPRSGGVQRTFSRFVDEVGKSRDDAVGGLARMMQSDPPSLADPTRLIRYLALRLAPTDTLQVARKLIKEWRAWHLAALNEELSSLRYTNPDRAREREEAIHEARSIVDRMYQEDHAA